jgi:hypothetical protein
VRGLLESAGIPVLLRPLQNPFTEAYNPFTAPWGELLVPVPQAPTARALVEERLQQQEEAWEEAEDFDEEE